ncbi:hypothetical protein [Pseudomonas chlororaphis]|nr:hypothetical protein [Pseudomonas chlororaphis]AZD22397.1 hypothetical protein C4K24_3094 [Pseudomonas chlororaphis subsp. aurantiaca]AZD67028.1 hypothetical protein C4K17_3142 [Pseudomonas chlororaphis subsp. aurantiaca]QIT23042.1 hypothetical protein HCN09_15315 [Pseudomonas chlororaphis subsp. aurantiaca]WDH01128.1 hypothetical protein PUP57_16450 [Pseudomonas chlororaphis]WDH10026.1 hypothetical protein PUP64_30565 [Pseudomonas chlororaphis]
MLVRRVDHGLVRRHLPVDRYRLARSATPLTIQVIFLQQLLQEKYSNPTG